MRTRPSFHSQSRYNELLAGANLVTPRVEEGNFHIYHQYTVRVRDRDRVKGKLAEAGVGSGVFYPLGLHLQECFRYLGHREGDFPETERASREVLALPIYPELTDAQLEHVANTLRAATA